MKSIVGLLLFCGIVLPGAAQSNAARYVTEPCPEDLMRPAAPGMICGRLIVLENRSAAASPEISLFVARVPAREESDRRPIIVLAGGPGDSASADGAWWQETPLRDFHDIILVDQRGTGSSSPSLNCPEYETRGDSNSLAKCRRRLLAAGIDLSAYRAESMAQDIADLVATLELGPVNVYARSYGARLALLLAQKLPRGLRAMVLDSAYTGEKSALASAAANAWRSMQRLYADCRANDACRVAYPELSTQFNQAAAALDSQPVEVGGILPGATFQLDGESFVLMLQNMLANSNRLPYIPALIAAIAEKDYGYLAATASIGLEPESLGSDTHSEGLYFSALCADETALTSPEKIEAGAEGLPPAFLPLVESALGLLADCGSWIDSDEGINVEVEPPPHDIPTLYLSGAYDPIAPAPGAMSASPLVWRQVFPHLGHGVLEDEPCAEALVTAFLANPTEMPLDGCLQDLRPPTFFIRQNE